MGLFSNIFSLPSDSSDLGSFFDQTSFDNNMNSMMNVGGDTSNSGSDTGAGGSTSSPGGSSGGNFFSSALGAGAKALGNSSGQANQAVTSKEYRAQREITMLNTGTQNPLSQFKHEVPTHTRDQFEAVQSTDPMTLERQWNDRLSQYANVTRNTGVSESGR